jgi:hypothetical protein
MDLSLAEKEYLQTLVESGSQVATVVYNPITVVGNPETSAINDGWVEFKRSDTSELVEVIYVR